MKKIIYGFLILGIVLGIQSCDKKRDPIFDESPTERLNVTIAHAYTVLQGNSNGWMMKYYPSSTQSFGGYTIFANFTSNVNVMLGGDFDYVNLNPSLISSDPNSSFEVYASSGPILTFNTYNSAIHYFSMPGQFINNTQQIGLIDAGYGGDFEFLVSKASADSVVLIGRKTNNKIVMLPISTSNASTIVQTYRDAVVKYHPLGTYHFEVGTETINATFVNTFTKRSLRIAGSTVIHAYRYVPEGLEFYKEYEVGGVKFKELKYVDPVGTYTKGYFTNDAGTIKLVPTT